jgi:hypothetical protein
MSRTLPPEFVAALGEPVVRPVLFYEGEFADGWLRLWTGYGEIQWGGRTWTGAGTLMGIGALDETQQVIASGSSVTLSGIPVDLVQMAIEQAEQGAPGRVYLGLMREPQRNFARGASAVGDPVYWPNSQVSADVTFTKIASGIDPSDGLPFCEIRALGTPTLPGLAFAYSTAQSRADAVVGEAWTASALVQRVAGSPAGVGRVDISVVDETAANVVLGSSISPTVVANDPQTIIATRTAAVVTRAKVRCQLALRLTVGTPVDVTYRIKGLQLERGRQRTAFQPYGAALWTDLVSDPVLAFGGRLDVPEIVDGAETCTITITYESRLIDLQTPRELRYTHESQQILFPGDRAFEYVTSIQDRELRWGT